MKTNCIFIILFFAILLIQPVASAQAVPENFVVTTGICRIREPGDKCFQCTDKKVVVKACAKGEACRSEDGQCVKTQQWKDCKTDCNFLTCKNTETKIAVGACKYQGIVFTRCECKQG